jgi:hypothetical protein
MGFRELWTCHQPVSEKPRLLFFVPSNSFSANGVLSHEFRQPFDGLVDEAMFGAQKWLLGCLPAAIIKKSSPRTTTNAAFSQMEKYVLKRLDPGKHELLRS